MRLLLLDFEGTGLDTATARIVEYGAVLYDWETKTVLRLASEFVDPVESIPPEITGITGITDDTVQEFGLSEAMAVSKVRDLMEQADYVVAHFGTLYDKPLFEAACARCMCLSPEKVWVDTSIDCPYPENIKTRNLLHLAAEHGFLPGHSHRAVFDVMTMLRILSQYDLDTVIARAKEPTLYVQAVVSFDEKEKAKERGYKWCAPRKIWWRQWKSSDYEAEKDVCGFRTIVLPGAPE